jgi:mRNA interferase MazF
VTVRGSICWADLGEAHGSRPGKRRPVLVIQSDPFHASRLNTTAAAVITSDAALAAMPGNVFLPAIASGLPQESVVNVTALVTLDKTDLEAPGHLSPSLMHDVDRGLRRQKRISALRSRGLLILGLAHGSGISGWLVLLPAPASGSVSSTGAQLGPAAEQEGQLLHQDPAEVVGLRSDSSCATQPR